MPAPTRAPVPGSVRMAAYEAGPASRRRPGLDSRRARSGARPGRWAGRRDARPERRPLVRDPASARARRDTGRGGRRQDPSPRGARRGPALARAREWRSARRPRDHRRLLETQPGRSRDWHWPVVGTRGRAAVGRSHRELGRRPAAPGRHRRRAPAAGEAGCAGRLVAAAGVGGEAPRRPGIRRGHDRCRPALGDTRGAVGNRRRNADRTAGLHRQRRSGGARAHRCDRQDRGTADRAAGAHAVRARCRDRPGPGAVQARGGGGADAAPSPATRKVATSATAAALASTSADAMAGSWSRC